MKKTVFPPVILALALIFALNCGAVCAHISVSSAAAKAGDTVDIPVVIENNPGFCYLRVRPEFDTANLELIAVKAGDVYADTVAKAVNISVENGSDMKGDGSILIMTFKIGETAEPGDHPVELKFIECYNYDEEDVAVDITGGVIKVTGDFGVITRAAENGGDTGVPIPRVTVLTENITEEKTKSGGSAVVIAACILAFAAAAAVSAIFIIKRKRK